MSGESGFCLEFCNSTFLITERAENLSAFLLIFFIYVHISEVVIIKICTIFIFNWKFMYAQLL